MPAASSRDVEPHAESVAPKPAMEDMMEWQQHHETTMQQREVSGSHIYPMDVCQIYIPGWKHVFPV